MRLFDGAISSLLLVSLATAAEPQAVVCPNVLLRGCYDGYCPKPEPCVRPYYRRGGCDDYCRKPCPCVTGFHGCSFVDCYCRKPCPNTSRPIAADWYTCSRACLWCTDSLTAARDPTSGVVTRPFHDARIPDPYIPPDSLPISPVQKQ